MKGSTRTRTGASPVLDWLVDEAKRGRYFGNFYVELNRNLEQDRLQVARRAMFLWTINPQWLGVRIHWHQGLLEAEMETTDCKERDADGYPSKLLTTSGTDPPVAELRKIPKF